MREYFVALVLASLPAFGNFIGGALAEFIHVSDKVLGYALYAAAGVIFAVVCVELMPQALASEQPWICLLTFLGGAVFFIGVDTGMDVIKSIYGHEDRHKNTPWLIYFGVAIDLFSDGLMIGTGSTISFGLGFLLALGQIPADLPEGFATIATFKRWGFTRKQRLLVSASLILPVFFGATLGYWVVRGQAEIIKLALLSFTAGILMTVAVEEILPEAHRSEEPRFGALMLIGGFILFTALSMRLGVD